MANEWKRTADKLKTHVHKSFEQIQKALEIREKLLLRQIDVLATQQHLQQQQQQPPANQLTIPIDQMKFIVENEATLLSTIRSFGKFSANNLAFSTDAFVTEDYIQPSDDHELMYKCLLADGGGADIEDDGIVVDFSNNKAIIEENANILNESIVNLTLAESRDLIEKSQQNRAKELIEISLGPSDSRVAEENAINNNINSSDIAKPIYCNKKSKAKLRLHSCSGTINLKNISNVTINANCRNFEKKSSNCRQTNVQESCYSGGGETDDEYASYNCEFYKRLMNEIRNTFSKQQQQHQSSSRHIPPYNTKDSSADGSQIASNGTMATVTTTTTTTATTTNKTANGITQSSKSSNCDFHSRKIFFTNLQKTFKKLNIPPIVQQSALLSSAGINEDDDGVGGSGGYCPHNHHHHHDYDIVKHPVQIEEWLKQIFLDTEIEPMQNVEILEHSNLTTNGNSSSSSSSSKSSSNRSSNSNNTP